MYTFCPSSDISIVDDIIELKAASYKALLFVFRLEPSACAIERGTSYREYFKASSISTGRFKSCDLAKRKPKISHCTATSIVFPVEGFNFVFLSLPKKSFHSTILIGFQNAIFSGPWFEHKRLSNSV